jgi:hypothetical protein
MVAVSQSVLINHHAWRTFETSPPDVSRERAECLIEAQRREVASVDGRAGRSLSLSLSLSLYVALERERDRGKSSVVVS